MGTNSIPEEDPEPKTPEKDSCHGCFKAEGCGLRGRPAETMHLKLKRAENHKKYFECHTIFADQASKPTDSRATKREHGEAGVQY